MYGKKPQEKLGTKSETSFDVASWTKIRRAALYFPPGHSDRRTAPFRTAPSEPSLPRWW